MTKSERTRQLIIEKTAPLFNSKGYDGTSLNDLTTVTGLTKGSLYGNVSDKDDIARAAFRYSMQKVKACVNERMQGALTCKEQLLHLLDFYSEYVFNPPVPGGCPLLNTAIEADDHRVSMRRIVATEILNTVNFIEGLLKKGVRQGEFQKRIDTKATAYTFFCCVEGAVMCSRVERSREPMDIIVSHCKNLLNQISNINVNKKSSRNRTRGHHATGKHSQGILDKPHRRKKRGGKDH